MFKINTTLHKSILLKAIVYLLIAAFISGPIMPSTSAFAQGIGSIPLPQVMVRPTPAYMPAVIRGVKLHPDNPFQFDFIVDVGDSSLEGQPFKEESTKLIKYFLASLTVPENDLWVNLSPYEEDRIVPPEFGITEMGRDMLAQDYLLKQFTASLMYPENEMGERFWERVYKKAHRIYGTTNIPINTFNKVWIVPEKAKIYENEHGAFVLDARLKVMLEEDYMRESSLEKHEARDTLHASRDTTLSGTTSPASDVLKEVRFVNNVTSDVVREVLIPEIEREVNEGQHFAQLRQIYHSLILATWYKRTLKNSILNLAYSDQNKVAGVDIKDKNIKDQIYEQYMKAFKQGVYNFIKEDYDLYQQQVIPRKYFSGGMQFVVPGFDLAMASEARDALDDIKSRLQVVKTDLRSTDKAMLSRHYKDRIYVLDELRQKVIPLKYAKLSELNREDKRKILHFLSSWKTPRFHEAFIDFTEVLKAPVEYQDIVEQSSFTTRMILSEEGQLLAYAQLNPGMNVLRVLEVHPDSRRRGIATEFIAALLQEFLDKGSHADFVIDQAGRELNRTIRDVLPIINPLDYIRNQLDVRIDRSLNRKQANAFIEKQRRRVATRATEYGIKTSLPDQAMLGDDPGLETSTYTSRGRHQSLDEYLSGWLRRSGSSSWRNFVEIGVGGRDPFLKQPAPTLFEWFESLKRAQSAGAIDPAFTLTGIDINPLVVKDVQGAIDQDAPEYKNIFIKEGSFSDLAEHTRQNGPIDVIRALNVLFHYTNPEDVFYFRNTVRESLSTKGIFIETMQGMSIIHEKQANGTLIPVGLHFEISDDFLDDIESITRSLTILLSYLEPLSEHHDIQAFKTLVDTIVEETYKAQYTSETKIIGGVLEDFPRELAGQIKVSEDGEIFVWEFSRDQAMTSKAEPRFDERSFSDQYSRLLRQSLNGPDVTEESKKRQRVLREIGPEVEDYMRQILGNEKVEIALIPKGSTLRGYSGVESDIEFEIYVLSGLDLSDSKTLMSKQKEIYEFANGRIEDRGYEAEEYYEQPFRLSYYDININSDFQSEQSESHPGMLPRIVQLLLPVAYVSDARSLENARRNAISYVKDLADDSVWETLQNDFVSVFLIDVRTVSKKPHLQRWLQQQGVDSEDAKEIEAFNIQRRRSLALPSLAVMEQAFTSLPRTFNSDRQDFTDQAMSGDLSNKNAELITDIIGNHPAAETLGNIFSSLGRFRGEQVIQRTPLPDLLEQRTEGGMIPFQISSQGKRFFEELIDGVDLDTQAYVLTLKVFDQHDQFMLQGLDQIPFGLLFHDKNSGDMVLFDMTELFVDRAVALLLKLTDLARQAAVNFDLLSENQNMSNIKLRRIRIGKYSDDIDHFYLERTLEDRTGWVLLTIEDEKDQRLEQDQQKNILTPNNQESVEYREALLYAMDQNLVDFQGKHVREIGVGTGINLLVAIHEGARTVEGTDQSLAYVLLSRWNFQYAQDTSQITVDDPDIFKVSHQSGFGSMSEGDLYLFNTPFVLDADSSPWNQLRSVEWQSNFISEDDFMPIFLELKKRLSHPGVSAIWRLMLSRESGLFPISDQKADVDQLDQFLTIHDLVSQQIREHIYFIKNANDQAMAGQDVGGIDFTSQQIDLDIDGSRSSSFGIDVQHTENIHIDGLIPVIINISPVTNIPLLLGVARDKEEPIAGASPCHSYFGRCVKFGQGTPAYQFPAIML